MIDKSNLTIEDLAKMNDNELDELEKRINEITLEPLLLYNLIFLYSLKEVVDVYKRIGKDFHLMMDLIYNNKISVDDITFVFDDKNEVSIKDKLYSLLRNRFFFGVIYDINVDGYPADFVEKNKDIFLIRDYVSDDVRRRYYEGKLTIDDILHNLYAFRNIPFENFMENDSYHDLSMAIGRGNLFNFIVDYGYVFEDTLKNSEEIDKIISIILKYKCSLLSAINIYCIKNKNEDGNYHSWTDYLFSNFVREYRNYDELENHNDRTFVEDYKQAVILARFPIEYIKRFEEDTKFFTGNNFDVINTLYSWISDVDVNYINLTKIETYEQFTDTMFILLRDMKRFGSAPDYDFITGDFRTKYPELFIDPYAPYGLRYNFYKGEVTLDLLRLRPDYITYLLDKDLSQVINGKYLVTISDMTGNNAYDFITYYSEKYGKKELLELLIPYGEYASDIVVEIKSTSLKEEIDRLVRDRVYKNIIKGRHHSNIEKKLNYIQYFVDRDGELIKSKFVLEHPDIFITEDIPIDDYAKRKEFESKFYSGQLEITDIYNNYQLVEFLKGKNLKCIFNGRHSIKIDDDELFLRLGCKYGRYLFALSENDDMHINNNSYSELCRSIEYLIFDYCFKGYIYYFPEDAPAFLMNVPELFLSEDAPKELSDKFYRRNSIGLKLSDLQEHKDWIPYLEDKVLSKSFAGDRTRLNYYFKKFGNNIGLRLASQKAETVERMLNSVDIMKLWYDKTGKRFIPDAAVMHNFPVEEIDSFLTSSRKWNNLMKIERYANNFDGRETLIKLAYSFGVFHNDQAGYDKLEKLLLDVPRVIPVSRYDEFNMIDKLYYFVLKYPDIYNKVNDEQPELLKESKYAKLVLSLIEEGFEIDKTRGIMQQIYREQEDHTYNLSIDSKKYPKSLKIIRELLEICMEDFLMTPDMAHKLFGGFKMKYSPDFREFLLSNLDEVMANPEYIKMIPNIQRQFDDIKLFNSNRVLTLDLAVSFVNTNSYENIQVGNEGVAKISTIAGYSQEDFNVLQQIYNYGKQRIFSSIPRVDGEQGKYSYEILRLDDPLAMAIGTLTDCCQKLGDAAEVCMEHSMVSSHGRVFVIRDNEGNIVAQSWVWRNKDVICFDNIEIPKKAFVRAKDDKIDRNAFTKDVYDIYKMAAEELILADEKKYKELLDSGKITLDEYEGLRLKQVTVGLGWNDIADVIKSEATDLSGTLARPLPFEQVVDLNNLLYTSDSDKQYVLGGSSERSEYKGDTLPIYRDNYIEYTDSTLDEVMFSTLMKLEILTKNKTEHFDYISSSDKGSFVSEIAYEYDLKDDTTRVVMNSNFAIIYDICNNGNTLKIADLFYNMTTFDSNGEIIDITDTVLLQIKLALEQITVGKNIDIESLNDSQKEVYIKAIEFDKSDDIKRSEYHGR